MHGLLQGRPRGAEDRTSPASSRLLHPERWRPTRIIHFQKPLSQYQTCHQSVREGEAQEPHKLEWGNCKPGILYQRGSLPLMPAPASFSPSCREPRGSPAFLPVSTECGEGEDRDTNGGELDGRDELAAHLPKEPLLGEIPWGIHGHTGH